MKRKLFENTQGNKFRLAKESDESCQQESRLARWNPEEEGDAIDLDNMGVWKNPNEVKNLIDFLMRCLDAGNFDMAHKTIDKLDNLRT